VVTLCTNPPQFFNGVGPTPDGASDDAAVEALRKLSEVGIEGLCGQSQTGLAVTEASARLVANFNLLISRYSFHLHDGHNLLSASFPTRQPNQMLSF